MRRILLPVLALSAALALGACEKSKEDILQKSDKATTREQLKAALGTPDDIAKLGPIETWTYQGSNGTVSFVLAGDQVTLRSTGEKTQK